MPHTGIHWTQRPENKAKLREMASRAAKTLRRKRRKVAKRPGVRAIATVINGEPVNPRQKTPPIPQHELIQAMRSAGYADAAGFVEGWIARG
jgi:hypothetical protein